MNLIQPMLLCQIEPPQRTDQGDYYYRTHSPGISMSQEEGVYVINMTNQHRKKFDILTRADVVVLKNVCDPDLLPIIHQRRRSGQLTLYEIADNLSAIQPWNPLFSFYENPDNLSLIFQLANRCDALQVTCMELKRIFSYLNPTCQVFPNQIAFVPPENRKSNPWNIVIGWGGSHGHLEDMAEIADDFMAWLMSKPGLTMHLMCSESVYRLFDAVPSDKKSYRPPGSLEDYFHFLSGIDIGIAPMKDTPFNRCRSDVKFLEYAVSNVAPVLRDLEPYRESAKHGKTGFLYRDSNHLIDILDCLVSDPALISQIAKAARGYVLKNRLQLMHGKKRVQFYRELLYKLRDFRHKNPHKNPIDSKASFGEFAALAGACVNGRHNQLKPTDFETLIHNGLVAMQHENDNRLALELFDKAASLESKNYLPYLYSASISSDPVGRLRHAVSLKPDSVNAWILMGDAYVRLKKVTEALQCYATATQIESDYDLPLLRAAALLERTGQSAAADKLLSAAKKLRINAPEPDAYLNRIFAEGV